MMQSVQEGFQKASFKGIEFYIEAGSTLVANLNNKTAVHQFLNSSSPLVEFLGKSGVVYNTKAIIQDKDFNIYKNKRKAFEDVLNEQSSGILIHPIDGRKFVSATGIFRSESLREINIAIYNLTFTETTHKVYPEDTGNKNLVLEKIENTKQANSNAFTKFFNVLVPRIKNNYQDTKKIIDDSIKKINENVNKVNATGDALAEYTREYQGIVSDITTLIKTPSQFVSRMQNLWGSILSITDNAAELFGINIDLIDTADTITIGESKISKQILSNEIANRNFNNVNSILNAFELANNINYTSQEELENTLEKINEKYYFIINDLDNDVVYNLENVRSQSYLYLQSIKGNLARVIAIQTAPTNITAISYKYYNDLTRTDEIESLNNITNNDYILGKLNILEF